MPNPRTLNISFSFCLMNLLKVCQSTMFCCLRHGDRHDKTVMAILSENMSTPQIFCQVRAVNEIMSRLLIGQWKQSSRAIGCCFSFMDASQGHYAEEETRSSLRHAISFYFILANHVFRHQ